MYVFVYTLQNIAPIACNDDGMPGKRQPSLVLSAIRERRGPGKGKKKPRRRNTKAQKGSALSLLCAPSVPSWLIFFVVRNDSPRLQGRGTVAKPRNDKNGGNFRGIRNINIFFLPSFSFFCLTFRPGHGNLGSSNESIFIRRML
jgi:hypothetical protein